MTRSNLLAAVVAVGIAATMQAQPPADPYVTGMTLFGFEGCPVFVAGVSPRSPAERAGIRVGDRLVEVDGVNVSELGEAVRLLRSDTQTPVALTLRRDRREIGVVAGRVRQSSIPLQAGMKIVSGYMVPLDTTQAEVERMAAFDGRRRVAGVFTPAHYPARQELYYPGFEIFVLRDPPQAMVGGIENGPASKAGMHWGDILVSVNDTPVAGKTPAELERMLCSRAPTTVRLRVDRLGSARRFSITLERALDVALLNGKRFVGSQLVPIWVEDADLHCFLQ